MMGRLVEEGNGRLMRKPNGENDAIELRRAVPRLAIHAAKAAAAMEKCRAAAAALAGTLRTSLADRRSKEIQSGPEMARSKRGESRK